MCIWQGVYTMYMHVHAEVRGQVVWVGSLLPSLCGFWGSHSGCQAVVLPSELSQWPRFLSLAYTEICFYYGRVNDCQEWSWSQRPTLENHDASFPAAFLLVLWWMVGYMWAYMTQSCAPTWGWHCTFSVYKLHVYQNIQNDSWNVWILQNSYWMWSIWKAVPGTWNSAVQHVWV